MAKDAFFTTCLSAFIVMVGVGIIAPLLPTYAEELGATGLWIGIIFSAYSLSRLIFLPLAGRLSDRYGRKRTITAGLAFYTIISIFYILSKTPAELSIVRLIHGVTSAMIIPVAMAYAAEISPEGREGEFMGSFSRCLFLGMAFGPLIGGVVSDAIGIRFTFLILSLLGLLTLILALLTFPSKTVIKRSKRPVLSSINNPVLKIAFIFRFFNSMGRGSIISFLPIYLGIAGFSKFLIGFLISINLFVSAIIQPSSGKLSDKTGVLYPITISSIAGAFLLFLLPRTQELYLLATLSVLLGVASSLSIPALGAIIAVEGKSQGGMGELMGILSASKSLGRIAGPIVSGIVYDVFGSGITGVQMVFTVSALLTLFAAIVFWIGMHNTPISELEG